ncbi:MAG: hypothetical protein IH595_07660 [Bacteroidales bacterium]|nr:hypothetical protein [Bacteroidales bacterium]
MNYRNRTTLPTKPQWNLSFSLFLKEHFTVKEKYIKQTGHPKIWNDLFATLKLKIQPVVSNFFVKQGFYPAELISVINASASQEYL